MNRSVIRKSVIAALLFVIDMASLVKDSTGKQVDWPKVGAKFMRGSWKVTLSVLAAKGATSLTVTALEKAVKKGTILDFGHVAGQTVTVSASALAAATSIAVNALTVPIPSGTLLDFGTNKFARTTANAAIGAVALTVAAIPTALAGGETAVYQGGVRSAEVSVDAAAGATALTVLAIPFAIATTDEAWTGGDFDAKVIPPGTIMADLTSGKMIPRVDVTGAETASRMLETSASSDSKSDSITGYGTFAGGSFWENQLPDASGSPRELPAGWKTELATNGAYWLFRQNRDSRAS